MGKVCWECAGGRGATLASEVCCAGGRVAELGVCFVN